MDPRKFNLKELSKRGHFYFGRRGHFYFGATLFFENLEKNNFLVAEHIFYNIDLTLEQPEKWETEEYYIHLLHFINHLYLQGNEETAEELFEYGIKPTDDSEKGKQKAKEELERKNIYCTNQSNVRIFYDFYDRITSLDNVPEIFIPLAEFCRLDLKKTQSEDDCPVHFQEAPSIHELLSESVKGKAIEFLNNRVELGLWAILEGKTIFQYIDELEDEEQQEMLSEVLDDHIKKCACVSGWLHLLPEKYYSLNYLQQWALDKGTDEALSLVNELFEKIFEQEKTGKLLDSVQTLAKTVIRHACEEADSELFHCGLQIASDQQAIAAIIQCPMNDSFIDTIYSKVKIRESELAPLLCYFLKFISTEPQRAIKAIELVATRLPPEKCWTKAQECAAGDKPIDLIQAITDEKVRNKLLTLIGKPA